MKTNKYIVPIILLFLVISVILVFYIPRKFNFKTDKLKSIHIEYVIDNQKQVVVIETDKHEEFLKKLNHQKYTPKLMAGKVEGIYKVVLEYEYDTISILKNNYSRSKVKRKNLIIFQEDFDEFVNEYLKSFIEVPLL